MGKTLLSRRFNWILPPEGETVPCTAKIRHTQFDRPATAYPQADGSCRVEFAEPQRAITPGQSVVLYRGDIVLGGGIIAE